MCCAEVGVVMTLFLVSSKLARCMLWSMRDKLLGLGGWRAYGGLQSACRKSVIRYISADPQQGVETTRTDVQEAGVGFEE